MKSILKALIIVLILVINNSKVSSQKIMKVYYDNYSIPRRLKEEFQIDNNGFKNGYYKSFHYNGMQYEIGQLKKDLKYGLWKTFDDNGKLLGEDNYKDDKRNGLSKVWSNRKGLHKLIAEHYYEMDKEIRTISYYQEGEGGIQSDIKQDGECKYLYRNGKPAKIWKNQNFICIDSTIKIWDSEGGQFVLNKIVKGISLHFDYNVEFDYSGEKSGSENYYITAPTKCIGDSAGWSFQISIENNWKRENDGFYIPFIINKTKSVTDIISKYFVKETKGSIGNLLWELRFLDQTNTYLAETEININIANTKDKKTTKISYNNKGELITKQIGISKFNEYASYGQTKYKFESQTISDFQTPGELNISIDDYAKNETPNSPSLNELQQTNLKGKIVNTLYSFEYDNTNEILTILIENKKLLSSKISLIKVINLELGGNKLNVDKILALDLDLLDNSPQSFFYYSSKIELFDENGKSIILVENKNPLDLKSSLYKTSIEKICRLGADTINIEIKPNGTNIFGQNEFREFMISEFKVSKTVPEADRKNGALRGTNTDLTQELRNFIINNKSVVK